MAINIQNGYLTQNHHRGGKEDIRIITPRLQLRAFTPSDFYPLHAIARHPDFSFYSLDGSKAKTQALLDKCIATQAPDPKTGQRQNYKLAITLPDQDSVIGYVSIGEINPASGDITDIGYFLHPDYQGRGYASEAVRHLCSFVIDHHNLPQIWATVHPDNIRSQNVLKALNFAYVGPKDTGKVTATGAQEPRLTYRLDANELNMTPAASTDRETPWPRLQQT